MHHLLCEFNRRAAHGSSDALSCGPQVPDCPVSVQVLKEHRSRSLLEQDFRQFEIPGDSSLYGDGLLELVYE
jgi:hypothetical protein